MHGRGEVLGREHLHGVVLSERRAHRVGAGGRLRPHRSKLEVHLAGSLHERRPTVEPEQRSVGIAHERDVILIAHIVEESTQNRDGNRQRVLLPAGLHLLLGQGKGRQASTRIKPGRRGPLPGALNHAAHRRLPGCGGLCTAGHQVVGAGELKGRRRRSSVASMATQSLMTPYQCD